MNNERYIKLLEHLKACDPAVDHIRDTGLSLAEAWEQSHRGDHMAWLLAHLVDRRRLALVLADVVEPTLAYVPDNENRPRKCVEALRKFARGEIEREELRAAGNAAGVASWAAGAAVEDAASAASVAASWAASWAAGGNTTAIIIRRHVSSDEIVALAEAYADKHGI